MGHIIAKFGDRYMEWTTVSDGPITPLLTVPELKRYILQAYGYKELQELPERIARADAQGTSSRMGTSAQDLLAHNAIGPNGAPVTTEAEMIRLFGPDGEYPGFSDPERLDIEEPLVVKCPFGLRDFKAKVTRVVAEHDNVVFAEVTVPDVDGTFPILFERDGTVLTKNFADLQVVYDRG